MGTKGIFIISGAVMLALTGTVSAGPMSVTSATAIAPPQTSIQQVHYRKRYHRHYTTRRYHRHYAYGHRYYPRRYYGGGDPGAAIAGAALGLMTLPFAAAASGWPNYGYGYYGRPYYGYYARPYYGYPYYW